MSDAEIRNMLIAKKKSEYKAIEKQIKAEMNKEMKKGVPLLLGCCVWIYLIAALPV